MTATRHDNSAHPEPHNGHSNGTHPARDRDVDRGGETVGHAKFDLGLAPGQLPRDEIPWSYGTTRITALARDPDWLYVYWEVTDEAIAEARARLGTGGADAWCCLRVYDTTGKVFDGTNANAYFDIAVDRAAREWFLHIGRPTSVHHVDIGMKSREGFFQHVARSGRAEAPRKSPSKDLTVEWMSVETQGPDGEHPTARPYRSRFAGPEPVVQERAPVAALHHPVVAPPPDAEGGAVPSAATPIVRQFPVQETWGGRWTEGRIATWTVSEVQRSEVHYSRLAVPWFSTAWRSEWQGEGRSFEWLSPLHALTWSGFTGNMSWVTPVEAYSWVAGPFPVQEAPQGRVEVRFLGGSQVWGSEGGSHMVVHGPWRITIRGGPSPAGVERRVLDTWMIHWVRPTAPVIERYQSYATHGWMSTVTWEQFVAGASENVLWSSRGGSEWWLMGASEWMYIGASELLWIGASEVAWFGASASAMAWLGASGWGWLGGSEVAALGASEWGWGGGSEVLQAGGSEQLGLGGSETFGAGGSEWALRGASELLYGGASEQWIAGASELLGASEWLGASERLGASELLGASEWLGGTERWIGASEWLPGLGASDYQPAGASDYQPAGASESLPIEAGSDEEER